MSLPKPIERPTFRSIRRFAAMVNIRGSDECWPWTGGLRSRGYGSFSMEQRNGKWTTVMAHRFAYAVRNDGLSPLLVCHRCDNRPCCNPAHLFVGTSRDNTLDMYSKGRAAMNLPGGYVGEKHGMAKLRELDVLSIRDEPRHITSTELAKRFGVSIAQISNIRRGKQWRHLGGAA